MNSRELVHECQKKELSRLCFTDVGRDVYGHWFVGRRFAFQVIGSSRVSFAIEAITFRNWVVSHYAAPFEKMLPLIPDRTIPNGGAGTGEPRNL